MEAITDLFIAAVRNASCGEEIYSKFMKELKGQPEDVRLHAFSFIVFRERQRLPFDEDSDLREKARNIEQTHPWIAQNVCHLNKMDLQEIPLFVPKDLHYRHYDPDCAAYLVNRGLLTDAEVFAFDREYADSRYELALFRYAGLTAERREQIIEMLSDEGRG